ncbi:uncharacterized protein N7459_008619 [Penicillium hispanicum]|uniref:uncharacterized protein n=1 Tax=Penicillium hispanicum TaxID=1080232 RepID=UPI0025423AFD|nr:uncharacterized protein N7459_008619 [Penicillium hispanicum]KAJ5574192.1 hypothetical protein N7459_008619 [Penicillium hispanicum]
MFVYRDRDLPPDPGFPSDLGKLGYTINDSDQIRQTANPKEGFKYKINRNDRYNIKNREAMNDCIRTIVLQRLQESGLQIMRLPVGRTAKEPHVPILVSEGIHHSSRIVAVFGEPIQDLGIWAYRSANTDGINIGSAVNFTKAVLGEGEQKTGSVLVVGNTGQLLWHCESSSAVTQQSWLAAPRPYGTWGQPTLTWRNKIPSNNDWSEHVECVFEHVIRPNLGPKTRVDVIGVSEGGRGAIQYLKKYWHIWQPYISGICLGDPLQTTYQDLDMGTLADPRSFTSFVSSRCRGYVLSEAPVGTHQSGYRTHGCNCYSSGEALNSECIIVRAWPDMLKWLDMLYKDPEYAEHVMIHADDMDEEMRKDLDDQVVSSDEEGDTEKSKKDDEAKADMQEGTEFSHSQEVTEDDQGNGDADGD